MQFPVPFIFSVMFNLLLMMSFPVFIYGQSFKFCKVLRWNGVADLQHLLQNVFRKQFVFFRYMAVGFYLNMFENSGSLEIKWKLFFKIDKIALSLVCYVLTSIVCGSLFFRVWSRNNSFLFMLATDFVVFFHSFSWKPRSMNLLHKILLFNR